jgi:hypothetical protein
MPVSVVWCTGHLCRCYHSPMRQLPEQCTSCGQQIATLERCFLPDGTEKPGAEVTFRESAEGGILCLGCAKEEG